jgi:choline dehydrogenase
VNGARGLWIADASVIPEIPTCNTHWVVTMIGERAARFVMEDA